MKPDIECSAVVKKARDSSVYADLQTNIHAVSIVILSYNRKEDLERCVRSVLDQTFEDYVVIIVDNGSNDGSRDFLQHLQNTLQSRLKLILNESNVGASEGRNQALRIIASKYVLFLDSDAELKSKHTLQAMSDIMNTPAGKSIGQLGGEIINGKIRVGASERNADGLFSWLDHVEMQETEYVPTSNCFMQLDILKQLGGFDPYYFYGYEDNDLGWRVRSNGLKCIMDERVVAFHHVSNTARTSTFFLFHRNRVRFLIKKERAWFLILLPFIDMYFATKLLPARIKEFSNKPIEQVAWLDADKKHNTRQNKAFGKLHKLFTLILTFSLGLLKAYWWNLTNLSRTLRIRTRNPDFIENEI